MKKIHVTFALMQALRVVARGNGLQPSGIISNTSAIALAKLGWVSLRNIKKVYVGHEVRKMFDIQITKAGRAALKTADSAIEDARIAYRKELPRSGSIPMHEALFPNEVYEARKGR